MHRLGDVLAFVKHGIYFIQHRRAEMVSPAKLKGRARGRVAFRHRHHARRDLRRLLALSDTFAETAIAAESGKTCHDEIAKTTQAGKGFRLRATGNPQPLHLDNRSRHQRCFRVVAESEAITDTCGDGDDGLKRATEFDAENIGAGIDPKRRTSKEILR